MMLRPRDPDLLAPFEYVGGSAEIRNVTFKYARAVTRNGRPRSAAVTVASGATAFVENIRVLGGGTDGTRLPTYGFASRGGGRVLMGSASPPAGYGINGEYVFASAGAASGGLDRIQSERRRSAAPSTGTWDTGETVYNSAESLQGVAGWLCVAGGAPGTWRVLTYVP